jgi:hypothetical protein
MILAFLLALPISVWLLSNVYSIIDEPSPVFAVLRLVVGICLVLVLLLITDRALLTPLAYALATVAVLHITAFWLLRAHAVGVPIFQRVPPPPPPLLSEQASLNNEPLLAEEPRNFDLD